MYSKCFLSAVSCLTFVTLLVVLPLLLVYLLGWGLLGWLWLVLKIIIGIIIVIAILCCGKARTRWVLQGNQSAVPSFLPVIEAIIWHITYIKHLFVFPHEKYFLLCFNIIYFTL